MRVVAFAYACEPDQGSEPGAGWAFARMLASRAEVWIVTRANNREAIEGGLPRLSEPERKRMHFIYVDLPGWARIWKRGRIGIQPYYLLWQAIALTEARRLHRRQAFDLAFHVTLANAWLGSLAGFIGPPFVYGPVGGTMAMPWRLAPVVGARGVVYEGIRAGFVLVGRYINPIARVSWRRASVVLAQSPETRAWFPRRYRDKVHVFPNVALDDDFPRAGSRRVAPRTAVFAGNLIPLKGLSLAIDALAELPGWTLVLCGGGRDERRLLRRVSRRGVSGRVRFLGRVPRGEVVAQMLRADVFVFPSLRDSAGWAVAEAVACGLPVVCLNRGGPPIIAGNGVEVTTVSATARAVAKRMASLSGREGRPAFALDIGSRADALWNVLSTEVKERSRPGSSMRLAAKRLG